MRLLERSLRTVTRKVRTSSAVQFSPFIRARSESPSSPSRNMERSQAPISFCLKELVSVRSKDFTQILNVELPERRGPARKPQLTSLLSFGHGPSGIGNSWWLTFSNPASSIHCLSFGPGSASRPKFFKEATIAFAHTSGELSGTNVPSLE